LPVLRWRSRLSPLIVAARQPGFPHHCEGLSTPDVALSPSYSRKREIEIIAERAWRERLRVKVLPEYDEPKRADSIVILKPPAHL